MLWKSFSDHIISIAFFFFFILFLLQHPCIASINATIFQDIPQPDIESSPSKHLYNTLTEYEKVWIGEHPNIDIAVMDSWPPFSMIDSKGKAVGIDADFLDLLGRNIGITFTLKPGPFHDNLAAAEAKSVDALMDATPRPDREVYLHFTNPYLTLPHIIVARKDGPFHEREEFLRGKTLALERGFGNVKYFRERQPETTVVEYPDTLACLVAVSRGEADAYAGNRAVAGYLIARELLTNLAMQGNLSTQQSTLCIGVRKDWPEFASILNKALDNLTLADRIAIQTRWVNVNPPHYPELRLTEQERNWLREHPVVRVSSEPDYAPFSFVEKSGPAGFSIDYMEMLADRAGLQLEYVTDSWDKLVAKASNREIDVLHTIYFTKTRANSFLFTEPYKRNFSAIFVRDGTEGVHGLSDLNGKTLAVARGDTAVETIQRLAPATRIMPFDSYEDILKAVSLGKADATVMDAAVAHYLIRELTLTNLVSTAEADIDIDSRDPNYRIAVRKDWPELYSILEKAMTSVTREEMATLETRWFGAMGQDKRAGLRLGAEERAWIREHPRVRVNGGDWPPLILRSADGKTTGISTDILNLVAGLAGFEVEYVDGPWSEMVEKLEQGELDLLQCLSMTPERADRILFTSPYLTPTDAVFVQKKHDDVMSLSDLRGKVLAVEEGTHRMRWLKEQHPDVKLRPAHSILEGLKLVDDGDVDAFIGTHIATQYIIQKRLFLNLNVAFFVDNMDSALHFGVRKDSPILASITQKALDMITESQKQEIISNYLVQSTRQSTASSETRPVLSYKKVLVTAIASLLVISLAALLFLRLINMEQLASSFGSGRFRLAVLFGLTLLVLLSTLIGVFLLDRIKARMLHDIDGNLRNDLNVVNNAVEFWIDQRLSQVKQLGRNPELVDICSRLLALEPRANILHAADAQGYAKLFFTNSPHMFPVVGYAIVDSNHITLCSDNPEELGTRKTSYRAGPEAVEKALRGSSQLVPPAPAKPRHQLAEQPKTTDLLLSFVGPIHSQDGRVIAALVLSVNPRQIFDQALQFTVDNRSLEVYAFTRQGRLVTPSRFDDQLRRVGLLGAGRPSAMNIILRDPGGDMLEGYRSPNEPSRWPFTKLVANAIRLGMKYSLLPPGDWIGIIESNVQGYRDYRGVRVFGAWLWEPRLDLGLAVEIDEAEALENFFFIKVVIFSVLAVTLFLSVGSTLLVLVMGERTRTALAKARDNLEEKVVERTAELRAKQARLEEEEEHSRLVLSSLVDGLFELDGAGRLTFINPAAAAMLGYDPRELLGKNIHALIHHTHADGTPYNEMDCPMRLAAARGLHDKVKDEVFWRRNGQSFPVDYSATPIVYGDIIQGAVVVFQDVTERRLAEKALRASEQRMRVIIENLPGKVLLKDRAGRHLMVNSFYEQIMGAPEEQILGRTDEEFLPLDIAANIMHMDREIMDSGLSLVFEERIQHPDGSMHSFLTTKVPLLDEQGQSYALVVLGLDITERKQAETALRESEAKFRRLFEATAIPLAYFDIDNGFVLNINPTFTQTFGYSLEDIPTVESWRDLAYPDPELRRGVMEAWEKAQRQTSSGEVDILPVETRISCKSGEIRNVIASGKSLGSHLLATFIDITERTKAEETLRHSENQLRTIFEKSPVGVLHLDTKGVIINCNHQAAEILGTQKDKLLGFQSLEQYTDVNVRNAIAAAIRGETTSFEGLYTSFNSGKFFHARFIFNPVTPDAPPSEVICTGEDITVRKEMEQSLVRERETLQKILDNSLVGVAFAVGDIFRYVNKVFETMTGRGRGDRASSVYVDPEERHRILEVLKRNGRIENHEVQFFSQRGDILDMVVSFHLVVFQGEQGVLGWSIDMSERKKAELALAEAKDAAEEITRAKSDFLANMSHEIRTPMNAIMGMTHLALQTDLNSKQMDYLNKIEGSAKSLLRILNDILDFSKIEAGKLDIERAEFHLDDVIDNLASLLTIQVEEKGLELLFHVEPDVPVNLVGDPLRLGQILINLAGNAIKFTEKGEIVISAQLVERDDESALIRFNVKDSGIGMSQEQQDRLFQSFSQADTSTTRKFGGTGLGLAICKKLTELMNGEIGARSEPGKGSLFWFTARMGLHSKDKPQRRRLAEKYRGMRVLVVDDSGTSLNILSEALSGMGFEPATASSGREALDMLERADRDPFALVLMDWKMPGWDGIETTKNIMNNPRLPKSPTVIMVTAYGREEIMSQAKDAGISGFLIKPVNQSVLFNTILDVLGLGGSQNHRDKDAASRAPGLANIKGAAILLAEDNEINQQVAREILESAGFLVSVANNGAEALDMVQARDFDLVLMDIQMPEMDGLDATARLRATPRFKELPIVAMTAHAMAGDREKSLSMGMNDHLTKPINPEELFATLIRWIPPRTRTGAPTPETPSQPPALERRWVSLPKNLDGVDMEAGLARVNNNRELYRELLVKTHDGYADAHEVLRGMLAKGNPDEARMLAHTIKSVAGNIGAHLLQDAASELEAALRREQPLAEEPLEAFRLALATVMEGLAPLAHSNNEKARRATPDEPVDFARLKNALERLLLQVRARKPRLCAPILEEMLALPWPEELAPDVDALEAVIKKYQFKDAVALVERLLRATGGDNDSPR